MTARQIINKAKELLNDLSAVRWNEAFLLVAINDGQRRIVSLLPAIKATSAPYQLVPGFLQQRPASAMSITGANHNMGADGSTVGMTITEIKRAVFDNLHPAWKMDTPDGAVVYAMFDPDRPDQYEVWPPQPDPAFYIDLDVVLYPTDCTLATVDGQATQDPDSDIDLPDEYADGLLYYVLFRAHLRDFRYSVQGLTERYWNKMLSELGLTNQREVVEAKKMEDKQHAATD